MCYECAASCSELQTRALAIIRERLVPVILVTDNHVNLTNVTQ